MLGGDTDWLGCRRLLLLQHQKPAEPNLANCEITADRQSHQVTVPQDAIQSRALFTTSLEEADVNCWVSIKDFNAYYYHIY